MPATIHARRARRARACWAWTCWAFSRTASRRWLEGVFEEPSLDMKPLENAGAGAVPARVAHGQATDVDASQTG
ncbi:hypothetical protein GCM10023087_17180 [Microbacterium rhizosphaerae]